MENGKQCSPSFFTEKISSDWEVIYFSTDPVYVIEVQMIPTKL